MANRFWKKRQKYRVKKKEASTSPHNTSETFPDKQKRLGGPFFPEKCRKRKEERRRNEKQKPHKLRLRRCTLTHIQIRSRTRRKV